MLLSHFIQSAIVLFDLTVVIKMVLANKVNNCLSADRVSLELQSLSQFVFQNLSFKIGGAA